MTARHPRPQPAGPPPVASAPSSRLVRLLVLALVLVPQAGVVLVQGFAPVLLREAPLVLLALHPFEPWSLLVSPVVHPVAFVAIVVPVRAVPYAAAFLLGRWYGDRGLVALRQGGLSGGFARRVERLFARAGGLLLVIYPGAVVSAMAGATGMRPRRFLPLVLTGLVLWAGLILAIGQVGASPLLAVTQFIDRSTTWLTVALLTVTVVLVVREWRARRRPTRDPAAPSMHADRAPGPPTTPATGPGPG